jgi:hypothetical protein
MIFLLKRPVVERSIATFLKFVQGTLQFSIIFFFFWGGGAGGDKE